MKVDFGFPEFYVSQRDLQEDAVLQEVCSAGKFVELSIVLPYSVLRSRFVKFGLFVFNASGVMARQRKVEFEKMFVGASCPWQGKYKEAINHHRLVLDLSKRPGENSGETEAYGAIADCCTELGDLATAVRGVSTRCSEFSALGPSVWASKLHRGASLRHDVRAYSRAAGVESRSCKSGVSAWRPKKRLASGSSSSRTAAANVDLSAVHNQAAGGSFSGSSAEPNKIVLEALGKVCTGPTQTKSLDEAQAFKVLDTILRSVKGELQEEDNRVSSAQLGAFFGAMTLRANSFPAATNWSEGERKALAEYWPSFTKFLPQELLFLADPEGSLFGDVYHKGQAFRGTGFAEARLVGALREVLTGSHLGYEEMYGLLRDILPLQQQHNNNNHSGISPNGGVSSVNEALIAAFLIVQRMNKETDAELKAYCMAFDDELGTLPTADVRSLTHYGDPYDGNTRFFRSTLFVAAVRASYGEACLLYGADWMPPKGGVTEEQAIRYLGGATNLSPSQAATFLEDGEVGFAYVSQREARPSLHSLVGLRKHIKKRPPIATTEKVQRYVRASGREATMAGFYHEGYEDPLLMLIRRRGMDAGLVVKGEEGALSLSTKSKSPDAVVRGRPLNYCTGFRPGDPNTCIQVCDGVPRESFSQEVVASDLGFESTPTPRVDRSIAKNVELGLAALRGEKGPAYDRIVLNAAMADHLLGCEGASDAQTAIERAKHAIDSGRALQHLTAYLERSLKVT